MKLQKLVLTSLLVLLTSLGSWSAPTRYVETATNIQDNTSRLKSRLGGNSAGDGINARMQDICTDLGVPLEAVNTGHGASDTTTVYGTIRAIADQVGEEGGTIHGNLGTIITANTTATGLTTISGISADVLTAATALGGDGASTLTTRANAINISIGATETNTTDCIATIRDLVATGTEATLKDDIETVAGNLGGTGTSLLEKTTAIADQIGGAQGSIAANLTDIISDIGAYGDLKTLITGNIQTALGGGGSVIQRIGEIQALVSAGTDVKASIETQLKDGQTFLFATVEELRLAYDQAIGGVEGFTLGQVRAALGDPTTGEGSLDDVDAYFTTTLLGLNKDINVGANWSPAGYDTSALTDITKTKDAIDKLKDLIGGTGPLADRTVFALLKDLGELLGGTSGSLYARATAIQNHFVETTL